MSKSLPSQPNLEHLKTQAKDLLKSQKAGDSAAIHRIRECHPKWASGSGSPTRFLLSDAQFVIAREYGFSSWAKLKDHVQRMTQPLVPFEELADSVASNDIAQARKILVHHPELKSRLNDPVPKFSFGATLLLAAVHRKNENMIDLLLQAGADINARSHWWAGSFGVLDGDRGLAPFLIERGAAVDAHAAAHLGMLDRLKELIAPRPDLVRARGGDGQTPLHFAANVEVADYLLDHGADIDARDVDHESTPAQYMVRDRQEVARRLVARGCRTDILLAAALGDRELVQRHLKQNPGCIEMTVSEKYFPKRDPRSGGSIYIWTLGHNKSPHAVARDFGHEGVFRLLMDASPANLKFAQACESGDEASIRELADRHSELIGSLAEQDRRKVTDAAQSNNTLAVSRMLKLGWPVDARGQHGATALHWAAFHGNTEMTRVILGYKAPLECLDTDFRGTPLGWAIHGSEHGWYCRSGDYPGTVEALLRAGSKVPEKIGGTPPVREVLERAARER